MWQEKKKKEKVYLRLPFGLNGALFRVTMHMLQFTVCLAHHAKKTLKKTLYNPFSAWL